MTRLAEVVVGALGAFQPANFNRRGGGLGLESRLRLMQKQDWILKCLQGELWQGFRASRITSTAAAAANPKMGE
jgi:hypothetical protein